MTSALASKGRAGASPPGKPSARALPDSGLSRALLEKGDRALYSRAIEGSPEYALAQCNDSARFSLAYQPVDIVAGYEARSPYGHHFSPAACTADLNPSDLTTVEQHAIAATPPAESPNPATRLDSYICSHGLLQSHFGVSPSVLINFRFLLENRAKIYEESSVLSTTIFDAGVMAEAGSDRLRVIGKALRGCHTVAAAG